MLHKDHIVCVDDEEAVLGALRQQLSPFRDSCEVDLATNGAQALELLDQLEREGESLALVIADQIMPGMPGDELLYEVHRRCPDAIKILLTGEAGLDAVVRAINRAGLDRYIAKPWDEPDLRLTVEGLLAAYRLRRENARLLGALKEKNEALQRLNTELEARVKERTAELARANQRLAQLAITDGLTGGYNHRYFQERLELEVERSNRTGLPLSLLMLDVDHFKKYNDRYGHPAGDEVLRRVAQVLTRQRRANDVVARYGGEEFAVLLTDTPRVAAFGVADQLRERIAAERFAITDGSDSASITVSIGVAEYPSDANKAPDLLAAADAALYDAKRRGRNQVAKAA